MGGPISSVEGLKRKKTSVQPPGKKECSSRRPLDWAALSALPWGYSLPACPADFGLVNLYSHVRNSLISLSLCTCARAHTPIGLLVLFLWRTMATHPRSKDIWSGGMMGTQPVACASACSHAWTLILTWMLKQQIHFSASPSWGWAFLHLLSLCQRVLSWRAQMIPYSFGPHVALHVGSSPSVCCTESPTCPCAISYLVILRLKERRETEMTERSIFPWFLRRQK